MEKVKISKERAKLLDGILINTSISWIFAQLAEWQKVQKTTNEMVALHHWFISDPFIVCSAIINGYEAELSKEERVRLAIKEYCNGVEVSQWIIDQIKEIYEGVNHE